MMKKTLAALALTTAVAVPLATASQASAAAPVYKHTVTVSSHSYIYWDRNWPYPNRSASLTSHRIEPFQSNSAYPGGSDVFYLTAAPSGNSYLEGVHEEAILNTKEIAGSGGRISVKFDNSLSYGGNCSGCWSNHQVANFSINANGTAYYELVNDHGDGTWGETDIVVTNAVTQ